MNNEQLGKEVKRLVHLNNHKNGVVIPVDILLQLGYLNQKDLEAWRQGRIDYLERVCKINLSKLTLINKLIHRHARELSLKATLKEYKRWGKGPKQKLRFSKAGIKSIEDRYATHYIGKQQPENTDINPDLKVPF